MKFSIASLSNIFARSAVLFALVLTLCLSSFANSYADTMSVILPTQTILQTNYSKISNVHGNVAGQAATIYVRSLSLRDRSTNTIGCETLHLSVTDLRSGCVSAGLTKFRSSSSESSTISTSQSSPTIHANRCESSSSTGFSVTVPFCSTKSQTHGVSSSELRANDSQTLLTGKLERSLRPRPPEPEFGQTSLRWHRHALSWQRWSPRSTPERHRYANSLTARSYVSVSPRARSSD